LLLASAVARVEKPDWPSWLPDWSNNELRNDGFASRSNVAMELLEYGLRKGKDHTPDLALPRGTSTIIEEKYLRIYTNVAMWVDLNHKATEGIDTTRRNRTVDDRTSSDIVIFLPSTSRLSKGGLCAVLRAWLHLKLDTDDPSFEHRLASKPINLCQHSEAT